jgi:hypothetical protein
LGNKIFSLIDAVTKFKKIGLIDTNLAELYYTFYESVKKFEEYVNFDSQFTTMTIKVVKENPFLETFKTKLLTQFETCRLSLHTRYQVSKYANLTYFYGPRLYDLTRYMIDKQEGTP